MTKPKLPRVSEIQGIHSGRQPIESGDVIEQFNFESATIQANLTTGVSFDECRIIGSDWTSQTTKTLSLVDVEVERSLLFGLGADGATLKRCRLRGVQAMGLVLSDATIEDVSMSHTKLDGANFRLAKLSRVHFAGCSMKNTDFSGAVFASVMMTGCDLDGATFDRAQIIELDLTSSHLGVINGLAGLKSATISAGQLIELAPQFANIIGLKIKAD